MANTNDSLSNPGANEAVAHLVSEVTETPIPRGEDLLPPELQEQYRKAKERLRIEPRSKKAV